MTPAGLLDEIAACEARVRAAQARQLELIAAFARGQRDGLEPGECEQTERAIGMEAAAALGVSISTARCRVGDADTLVGRLPAVLAALAQGRIGLFAARQVCAAADAAHRSLLAADVDAALAEEAALLLPGQVRAAADARIGALDPAAAARRADQARSRRDVWVAPKPDGVATLARPCRPSRPSPAGRRWTPTPAAGGPTATTGPSRRSCPTPWSSASPARSGPTPRRVSSCRWSSPTRPSSARRRIRRRWPATGRCPPTRRSGCRPRRGRGSAGCSPTPSPAPAPSPTPTAGGAASPAAFAT